MLDQRRLRTRTRRRVGFRHALAAIPIVLAGALITAPVAQAAGYSYFNAKVSELSVRYSGQLATIGGGKVTVETFGADGALPLVYIETYRDAPGYRTIGFASGGTNALLSHQNATFAKQKCWWDWPWTSQDIGSLRLTCVAR